MPWALELIVSVQMYWLPGKCVPDQSSLCHRRQVTTAGRKGVEWCLSSAMQRRRTRRHHLPPLSTILLLPIRNPLNLALVGKKRKHLCFHEWASPYCGSTQWWSNWCKMLKSCFPLFSSIFPLNSKLPALLLFWVFLLNEVYDSSCQAWGLWVWCLNHSLITFCKCKHHQQQ